MYQVSGVINVDVLVSGRQNKVLMDSHEIGTAIVHCSLKVS